MAPDETRSRPEAIPEDRRWVVLLVRTGARKREGRGLAQWVREYSMGPTLASSVARQPASRLPPKVLSHPAAFLLDHQSGDQPPQLAKLLPYSSVQWY